MSSNDPRPGKVDHIVAQIMPLLAGNPPEVQGGVLGDLVAMFIAGHHPGLREEILTMHIALVRTLVPVNEGILRDQGRIPPEWRPQ